MTPARDWRDLPESPPSAVALGNFDGVHLGHRRILTSLRELALREGLEPLALSFDPHPRHFFSPGTSALLLTPPMEKEARIAALGVRLITLRFDAGLSSLPARSFAAEVLAGALNGRVFFLGPGHRFGRGAEGNAAMLEALPPRPGEPRGPRVVEVEPVAAEGETVSSSAIRRRLAGGDLRAANLMLGQAYTLRGNVVAGRGEGRTLGFPTANLELEDPRKFLPAFGVYGGAARLDDGRRLPAVANIGIRPTFGDAAPSVETHILDWEGDLYGRRLEFELRHRLRDERRFDSTEALRARIAQDAAEWRAAFSAPSRGTA